jgi:hypothetical protein
MKASIDIKSALAGLVVGVLAVFAIGAGGPSDHVGRYRVSIGPAGNAMLVDTTTGKVWAAGQNTAQLRQTDAEFYDSKK